MKNLTLHLKKQYFQAIAKGLKTEEYRLVTPYWEKRIQGQQYETITLLCGYPKRGDVANTLVIPWRGYERATITHPHFGASPVEVFAIFVAPNTASTGQVTPVPSSQFETSESLSPSK